MSTASPIKTNEQVRLNPIVFFGSTALILVLTAALILYPDSAGALLGRIQAWLSHSFGWYYMLAIGAYLFFVAWVAFSRFGTLKPVSYTHLDVYKRQALSAVAASKPYTLCSTVGVIRMTTTIAADSTQVSSIDTRTAPR